MKVVNTKGQLCPAPLIAAKRALKESAEGESFILITDNKTAFENLTRFLNDNKAIIKYEESQGIWTFTVTKTTGDIVKTTPEEYCEMPVAHFEKGNYVVAISSDKMGDGDDKLGALLMITFINALKDMDELPHKVLFYNSGVKLAIKDSPVIGALKDLEKMGVELILCGTCVNHYSLADVVGVGTIGNMYSIAAVMASTGKVLKP